MGEAAAELADVAVVTSDNPRSEDPAAIIAAVISGIPASASSRACRAEPDRRAAIALALAEAAPGDVVLIAGKGHETTQTIGDRVAARSTTASRRSPAARRASRARVGCSMTALFVAGALAMSSRWSAPGS